MLTEAQHPLTASQWPLPSGVTGVNYSRFLNGFHENKA
jgi:hypothetical protein